MKKYIFPILRYMVDTHYPHFFPLCIFYSLLYLLHSGINPCNMWRYSSFPLMISYYFIGLIYHNFSASSLLMHIWDCEFSVIKSVLQ